MDIYLDEDVTARVASPLRASGHDAIHANEVGRKGRTDPQQLAFATAEDRVLVTCNHDDFLLLHEAWLLCPNGQVGDRTNVHAGIAIVPNSSRISDAELISVIEQFGRDYDAPAGRLFRWRRSGGWQEIHMDGT
jgi:hypothetical protein